MNENRFYIYIYIYIYICVCERETERELYFSIILWMAIKGQLLSTYRIQDNVVINVGALKCTADIRKCIKFLPLFWSILWVRYFYFIKIIFLLIIQKEIAEETEERRKGFQLLSSHYSICHHVSTVFLLEQLDIGGRMETIQTTELLRLTRVLKRLAVTQTPVREHLLIIVWKTDDDDDDNNNNNNNNNNNTERV